MLQYQVHNYSVIPIPQSKLSDVSPNEEFTTSLGVDQSVRITARPVAVVHGNTGVLTKSNLVTYAHAFVVKNTRSDTVSVKVLEQLPLSTDDRIKVGTMMYESHSYKGLGMRLSTERMASLAPSRPNFFSLTAFSSYKRKKAGMAGYETREQSRYPSQLFFAYRFFLQTKKSWDGWVRD